MSDSLKFSMRTDAIGELVLSQPTRRNALNAQMWAGLPKVLKQAENTQGLKVLIVRGDGDHFAAGADISEFEELYATKKVAAKTSKAISNAMTALADFPLPTIALIRGACVGGGCGLALCCDLRASDQSGKFAITPAKLGLVYPYSDVQRLIETVGIPTAKDILFSARVLEAQEAKQAGLINALVDAPHLDDFVMDYANGIAALSTTSTKVTKHMFKAYQTGQRGENKQTEQWFLDSFASNDFKEGYSAFLEKRKPDFS